jgi:hypothetical protein
MHAARLLARGVFLASPAQLRHRSLETPRVRVPTLPDVTELTHAPKEEWR